MSTPHKDNPHRRISAEDTALQVVKTLVDAGHTALFAGGCVRDMLMGTAPSDYDVATSARPEEVLKLFRRTQSVGAKFGVVLVHLNKHAIEVATFRNDLKYEDGRRPTGIEFSSPEEDAKRRDFTVNGMFYNPLTKEVVDYVGGQTDLKAQIIRAIGEPEQRFAEDHLRLLRAIRFAARLGFEIEPRTWEAIVHHAEEIRRISPERILMELTAILSHPHRAKAVDYLHRSGLLYCLGPEADALRDTTEHAIRMLAFLPSTASFELSFAALLHTQPIDRIDSICKSLRTSNDTLEQVCWLTAKQDVFSEPAALTLADLKLLMAHRGFEELTALFASKLHAYKRDVVPRYEIDHRVQAIPRNEIAPPPLLTGHDLAALGVPQGPAYKKILDRVYYRQLNDEIRNREAALALARELITHL